MNQENIGKFISNLRKENNLTQQELGDILGVSSKTISKWECNNSIPDITILKKISQEFKITIEDLLEGKITKHPKNKLFTKQKVIITSLLIIIILITSIIVLNSKIFVKKDIKNNQEDIEKNNCIVIRTYDIINLKDSNNENYVYITLSEFQVEGTYTIKLPKILTKDLKENKSYIFTFTTSNTETNATTDILFEKTDIINIEYTDKIGLERENYSYCNKEGV